MSTTIIAILIILLLIGFIFWQTRAINTHSTAEKAAAADNAALTASLNNANALNAELKLNAERNAANQDELNHRIQSLTADNASKAALLGQAAVQIDEQHATIEKMKEETETTNQQMQATAHENARLTEQLRLFNEEKKRLEEESRNQFKNLANEILDDKTKRFKELNETRIAEILTPFKESITKLESSLRNTHEEEVKGRAQLNEHLKMLQTLNESIGKEAKDLTKALKGNSKVQGDWGEMVLENILEQSGLEKGTSYTIQQTRDENGATLKDASGKNVRPDVVVNFPDKRCIVIDSKVSLTAYVNYTSTDDPEEQKKAVASHLASVKKHLEELKGMKYQNAISKSADFVVMFIPNEGAYALAMQQDDKLWNEAYQHQVIIMSPTNLVSMLKLAEQLWQHDKQTKNAIEIARQAGDLYDKFVGFAEDMVKIEKGIDATSKSYADAMKKLKSGTGNLIGRVERIKALGAKASKNLKIEATE